MDDTTKFLAALADRMRPDERLIFCGFAGDPNHAPSTAWRPRPWRSGDLLPINPQRTNGYITIASFKQAADNSWRRRSDLFSRGFALMVDDVRTKVPVETVELLSPSAIVETSPGNEQWWYLFDRPVEDKLLFDALIKSFIESNLLGNDPGMNGVNRVGRIPGYINGKEKYNGFRVRLLELNDKRYTVQDLKDAFKLKTRLVRRRARPAPTDARDRIAMFMTHYNWMKQNGMLKASKMNVGGWMDIHCPWTEEHTNRADTGAGISEPSADNEWYGAFQCHHGHCIDRTWRELTDYIATIAEDTLEQINKRAGVK